MVPALKRKRRPRLDPTINVKEALAGDVKRLDDLRDLDRSWRDKYDQSEQSWRVRFDAERQRADAEAKLLERGRLDALRAGDTTAIANALNTAATAATTLQAQVVASATALSTAAQATREAQDRAIQALQLIQATTAGGKVERTETRGQTNLDRSLLLSLLGLLVGAVAIYLGTHH